MVYIMRMVPSFKVICLKEVCVKHNKSLYKVNNSLDMTKRNLLDVRID